MKTGLRITLIIAGLLAGFVVLLGGGAWLWWKNNEAALRAEAEQASASAQRFGREHRQQQCLPEALKRSAACGDFACRMAQSAFTGVCLAVAAPSDGLCEGVPAADSLVDVTRWTMARCEADGVKASCPAEIYSQLAHYCASQAPVAEPEA